MQKFLLLSLVIIGTISVPNKDDTDDVFEQGVIGPQTKVLKDVQNFTQ